MNSPEFQQMVDSKRAARMATIDSLPESIRDLVHFYGYASVKTLMDCGVSKPGQIRHCIETILDEFSPTRGSYSAQGVRKDVDTGCMYSHPKQEGRPE